MEFAVKTGERRERVWVELSGDGRTYEVRVGETSYAVDAAGLAGGLRSLLIAGRQYEVEIEGAEDGRYRVSCGGARYEVVVTSPLAALAEEAGNGRAVRGDGRITAYMAGRVVEVQVQEGDLVALGQDLIVLEAMKMQNEILAERPGTVKKVHVVAGQAVESGDLLFEIE